MYRTSMMEGTLRAVGLNESLGPALALLHKRSRRRYVC